MPKSNQESFGQGACSSHALLTLQDSNQTNGLVMYTYIVTQIIFAQQYVTRSTERLLSQIKFLEYSKLE